jgi:hypothetical protein
VWSGERTSAAFASGIVHPAPHPTTSRSTVSTHASRAARYALIADGLAGSRSHVSHAFSKEPRPSRSVASAVSRGVPGALLDMVALADATSDQLRAGLEPIVVAYREWLDVQQDRAAALPPHLRDDAAELVPSGSISATPRRCAASCPRRPGPLWGARMLHMSLTSGD